MGEYTFIFVSIILIAVGLFVIIKFTKKQRRIRSTGVKVTATVTAITQRPSDDSSGNITDKMYITYAVNGKEYKNILDQPSSNGKVGDKVEIYADIKNPHDFVSAGYAAQICGIIAIVAGVLVAVLGFVFVNADG